MVSHVPPLHQHRMLHPSESAIRALSLPEGASLKSGNVAARLTWAIEHARWEVLAVKTAVFANTLTRNDNLTSLPCRRRHRSRGSQLGKKVVIVVCGSLFVAAEAREFLFR